MPSSSSHFENKIRQLDYHNDTKSLQHSECILDAYGQDGWELASAVPIVEGGKTVRVLYCMKKQTKRAII